MAKKVCAGCGASLQSLDPSLPGYVPSNLDFEQNEVLCQRCFKLKHYNTNTVIKVDEQEYLRTMEIETQNNIILYVIDIFNFYGSLIPGLNKYAPSSKIIVLVNKIDVFPHIINQERLLNYIKMQLKVNNIPYDEIEIISATHNYHFDELLNLIKTYPTYKNIYLIGNANTGKSSIINTLMKSYCNTTQQFVTTSLYPGTTLKLLKIPFINDCYLYDTPGLYSETNIYHYVDNKNLKYILPKKEMKPVTFQLNPQQSLFLGSLCRLDVLKCPKKTPFIVFCNHQVKLHRTKLDENIARKFDKFILDPLFIPKGKNILTLNDLQATDLLVKSKQRMSLFINGLATIDILGNNVQLRVYAPKGVKVELNESFLGGENNVKW